MKSKKLDKESIFETMDVFSKSFEFTFGGKDKFKSYIGGYFTFFTFFIVIYLIWLLGKEILYRNLPKDYQVISIRDSPQNLTLMVPTGFMIQDNRGNIKKDYERFITFEAKYYNKARVNGTFIDAEPPKTLLMRECKSSDFSDEVYTSFVTLQMDSAQCLDEREQVLGGDFTTDFVKFVSIRITPCFNTTERQYCPAEESFKFLNVKNLVVSLKSEKILYTSADYAKPVKKIINEDNILIDPYIFNFPKYQMYEFNVQTDDGLIGQSTSIKSYYEYTFLNDIITAFDNNGNIPTRNEDLILYEYTFFESSNIKTQIRSYLKLTDVLASLGGLLKVYIIVFNFVFHKIYERIMYEQVITRLFNFEKVSINSQPKKRRAIANTNGKLPGVAPGTFPILDKIKNEPKIENNSSKIKDKQEKEIKIFKESEPADLVSDKVSELGNTTTKPFKKIAFFKNNFFLQKLNSDVFSKDKNSSNLKKLDTKIDNKSEYDNKSQISSSAVTAFFSKKKIRNSKMSKKIFSLTDHMILSFLPCCNKCSSKLQQVDEQFRKLIQYMYRYIDVLQMMKQFHELQLIKFVLFNKKQLAIFQNIGMPEDPFNKNKVSRVNDFHFFQQDFKEQKNKAKEFFLESSLNESKIDKRLKKLYLG
jgi:hypothetical protein